MECFVKKIFTGKMDEETHRQFVRFGRGKYEGRAVLSFMKNEKVKVKGSSEYANDFVELASELGDVKFSGIILSKEELNLQGKKKAGIFEYEFSGNSEDVRKIKDKAYGLLLDGEGQGISLKMKKKLPKPGKGGEGKVDDKFCQLEADIRYWGKIKEAFFWDISECKKARIVHAYNINDIVMPKGEKDFDKIRILARRKGSIVRKIEIEGKVEEKSKEMEV